MLNNSVTTTYSQLKIKRLCGFKWATGMNFTGVLHSQRLRKIHTSSCVFFLQCIDYTITG